MITYYSTKPIYGTDHIIIQYLSDQHRSLLKHNRAKHKYSVEGIIPQPAFRFCPIIKGYDAQFSPSPAKWDVVLSSGHTPRKPTRKCAMKLKGAVVILKARRGIQPDLQTAYVFGYFRGSVGQFADFAGNNRKPSSLHAGSGGLNAGI